MTEENKENGYINIEIQQDKVSFGTNLPLAEMNFWLDHVKNLLITGQAQVVEQE